MEWKVTNALSRDVERQNLNKILAEIRAAVTAVDSKASTTTVNTGVQDAVGAMVNGNKEVGINVTYDSAKQLLDFVVTDFTIRLIGDVEGSGVVEGLRSVTLQTTLNSALRGVEEAPLDGDTYWRTMGEWEPVDQSITAFAELIGNGFPARVEDDVEGEYVWNMRTLQPPAAGFTITNPAGEAGDPTFVLANDLAAVEALSTTGVVVRTALETWATRTLTAPAAGFTITNPAGIAGNPTFVLSDDLAALEGLASTGLAARTAANTWAQRSIATASVARITVTNGDGVSGNPTLDLATVADAGGGTLQKTVFDTYGRKTGTSSATTTDLPEGSNLYFTAARVLSTVLTGLSTATNAVITAADTVLSALGKLQAQITANAATITGLVIDSIADADTTHAPSRNAVFDALALKADDSNTVHKTGTESIAGAKTFTNDTQIAHAGATLFDVVSTDDVAVQVRFISNSPSNRRFLGQSSAGVTESQINFGAGEIHIWGATTAAKLLHISPTAVDPDDDNVKTSGAAAKRWSAVYSVTPAAGDNSDKCATTAFVNTVASSGTYTPTLFNTTNVAASTAYVAQWTRVGNVVTVSGKVDIDPTSASVATLLGISLPVASALASEQQLGGTAACPSVFGYSAAVMGDLTNDRASLQFINGTDVTNRKWSFIFQYLVV